MDLQSFCVENRRKVHSFPFLRTAVKSTDKMSNSFQFGVPVSSTIMEENCLKNIHNMSCNAQFTFEGIAKNQDCPTKKLCFDQLNRFSHFTFSKVVGGFVGSKSQGGSASREPHQVWDVIFRQLMDTACETTMHNNAQQYLSIGEAVSQSIFGQFNNSKNSTLGFSSYIFARPCDFFDNKRMTLNMQGSNSSPYHANGTSTNAEEKVKLNKIQSDDNLHSVQLEKSVKERLSEMPQSTAKQSYADVAKAYIATRPDNPYNSERHQTVQLSSLSQKNKPIVLRQSRRENEKFNSKRSRQNGSCYSQSSYNHSSQNQQRKKQTIMLEKFEDKVPSRSNRDKYEHTRYLKSENLHVNNQRAKVNGVWETAPVKEMKIQEDRKSRQNKFRNHNLREKERKNIDLQMQEEAVYACNMREQECQNWRCGHNRNFNVSRRRIDFCFPRGEYGSKKYKQQSRLHSPPPRTFVTDSVKNSESKTDDNCSKKRVKEDSKFDKKCEETLCNSEKSTYCSSLNLPRNDDSSESSNSISHAIVLSQRPRVASECSIDSDDSYVVFEKDDHGAVSDSCSDCSSEQESDEDCDEVDFCYVIPSENISTSIIGSPCTDAFSLVPDRLKDINTKWKEENAVLPKVEKVPKKVHFPRASELVKVHRLIHWTFAYREARRGHWEEVGRDRCRFQLRIERAERDLSCVLNPDHRRRIWEERMGGVNKT